MKNLGNIKNKNLKVFLSGCLSIVAVSIFASSLFVFSAPKVEASFIGDAVESVSSFFSDVGSYLGAFFGKVANFGGANLFDGTLTTDESVQTGDETKTDPVPDGPGGGGSQALSLTVVPGYNAIKLNWNQVTNATGYTITRWKVMGGNNCTELGQPIDPIDPAGEVTSQEQVFLKDFLLEKLVDKSFAADCEEIVFSVRGGTTITTTNSGLDSNQAYKYKIETQGLTSNIVSDFVQATTVFRAPETVKAVAQEGNKIKVTWESVPGINNYNVVKERTYNSPKYNGDNIGPHSYNQYLNDTLLQFSKEEGYDKGVSYNTTSSSGGKYLYYTGTSWQENITGTHDIFSKIISQSQWDSTNPALGIIDTSGVEGKSYTYKVYPIIPGVASTTFTSSNQVVAGLIAPTNFYATVNNLTGKINLTWNSVSNRVIDGYKIRRASSPDLNNYTISISVNASSSSFLDTGAVMGSQYKYSIISYNLNTGIASDTNYSNIATAGLIPPANVEAIAGSGVINVSWTAVLPGQSTYIIERYEYTEDPYSCDNLAPDDEYYCKDKNFYSDGSSSINTNSFIDNTGTIRIGTKYKYYVKTKLYEQDSGLKGSGVVIAGLIPPTTVTATPSSGKVVLDWSGVSGATGYQIYRGVEANTTKMTMISGVGGTTTYTDIGDRGLGLENGETYYYAIKTVFGDNDNFSDFSVVKLATPLSNPKFTVQSSQNTVIVKFSGEMDHTYKIYRKVDSGSDSVVWEITVDEENCTGGCVFTDTNLDWGEKYYYSISNEYQSWNGSSGKSDPVSVTINLQKPIIQKITGDRNKKQITVIWDEVAGASRYELYDEKGDSVLCDTENTNCTPELDYDDTISYTFKIKAFAANGVSSDFSDAKTLLAIPEVTASSEEEGVLKLSWNKIEGASTYNLKRDEKVTYQLKADYFNNTSEYKIFSTSYLDSLSDFGAVGKYICDTTENVNFIDFCRSEAWQDVVRAYQDIESLNLSSGTSYSFILDVEGDANSFSTDSDPKIAMLLEIPGNFAVTPGAKQNVLSWAVVSGATGYEIKWGTDNNNLSNTITLSSGTTTMTTHSNLTAPSYYYKIKAKSDSSESLFSSIKSGSPTYFSGVIGKIYYDFDGNGEYGATSSDKYVQYAVVNLYSEDETGGYVLESSQTINEKGDYSFDALVDGKKYGIEVNPKKIGPNFLNEESNLYTVKGKEKKIELIYKGEPINENIGLHSLNTDRQGDFTASGIKVDLADLNVLINPDYYNKMTTSSSGFNFLDLNYDGKVDLADLNAIIDPNYYNKVFKK